MITLRNFIFALAAVLCLGAVGFFLFLSGNKDMPAKQLSVFAQLVSKDSDEHELTAALRARKIAGLFADECRVEISSRNISKTYASQDISSEALSARSRYSLIQLEFDKIKTDFVNPHTAKITGRAFLETGWTGGGGMRGVYEGNCQLEKVEKKWVFTNIRARLVN